MKKPLWSIRSKIIALVSVPLAAFLAIWIFATLLTVGPALNLLSAREMVSKVGNPGQLLVAELQRERRLSVQYLATPGPVPATLAEQRIATDRAVAGFRGSAGTGDVWDDATDEFRERLDHLLADLDVLAGQRTRINQRDVDVVGAQGVYNEMTDAAYEVFASTADFGDARVDADIAAVRAVGRGQEYLARIDSLLAGATLAGTFGEPLRAALVQDVGVARFLLHDGVDALPESDRAKFAALAGSSAFVDLSRMMDTLVEKTRAGSASPVPGGRWHDAYVASAQQLRDFELNAIDELAGRTTPVAVGVLTRLALAAALGLVALAVSIVVSVRVGRSLVGRLRRLRGEALEMAGERLPGVVRRLQRGETVDVGAETPPLEYGADEIGELGRAFNDVQRTAVQSAVEEANVRRGLNEVFLNIARRSQTLLHRQLALLDKMERRETEPAELEDLYRVDHLATRMRRHAEDLVILAGAAPGRGWRNPVSVIDVVRGAISEVEDYKRVDIRAVESAAIHGRAVGDVIHLLAELLENAASFSPPDARVQVVGRRLPDAYTIEIEDGGLGMTPEALAAANARLAEPPDFDPTDSARLGLFVVAQLANRHGIGVTLRSSGRGITAVVSIPGGLVTAGPVVRPPAGVASVPSPAAPIVHGEVTVDLAAIPLQRRGGRPANAPAPAVGSVPDGVTAEGLMQRRRVRNPPAEPAPVADGFATPRAVPRHSGTTPAPASAASVLEDGLPRRVRQANLVPQLRRAGGTAPGEETVVFRSPEQVRSIMSALQQGTTRGRRDADRYAAGGRTGVPGPPTDDDVIRQDARNDETGPEKGAQ